MRPPTSPRPAAHHPAARRSTPAVWSLAAIAALAVAPAAPGLAQSVTLPAKAAPGVAVGFGVTGGSYTPVDNEHPLPVGGRQEAFALVVANLPAAAVTVYGGDYVFAQSCAGYGSVALRVRGPDGATMKPIVTRTASDADGGTGVTLGSGAAVDAAVSGTTGCNATLSRVP